MASTSGKAQKESSESSSAGDAPCCALTNVIMATSRLSGADVKRSAGGGTGIAGLAAEERVGCSCIKSGCGAVPLSRAAEGLTGQQGVQLSQL